MAQENTGFSLGIRSKYIIVFLICALISIVTIAFNSWSHANKSLTEANLQHLVSLRTERIRNIQSFFKQHKANLQVLSTSQTIVSAVNDFKVGYDLIALYNKSANAEQKEKLIRYYRNVFYKRMKNNVSNLRKFEDFTAFGKPASYLQFHYIADNPNAIGEKDLLIRRDDGSYYSEVHEKYHDQLRVIAKEYGFNDFMLIDKNDGAVVYSVSKNTDFGTNILTGPYANSTLSRVVQDVIKDPIPNKIYVQDFESYEPAFGAPQIILAMPIFSSKEFTGIMAAQIPASAINTIMTHNESWKEDGLGESGEVYLLGSDSLMRSNSRFLIEDKPSYLSSLKKNGEDPEALTRIDLLNTSVLQQTVKTRAAVEVLNGKTGEQTINSYYGSSVLSVYSPLSIPGLKWSVLAEKNMGEVTRSTRDLQLTIMISAVSLVILIGAFAMVYSTMFMRPILAMLDSAKNYLRDGTITKLNIHKSDEIGQLADDFDRLMDRLEEQETSLTQEKENTRNTLLNFLPESVAAQIEGGQKKMSKLHDNVAVTYISLRGINSMMAEHTASEVVDSIASLYGLIDQLTERHELEKFNIFADNYILTCGLYKPRLDYSRRCVSFCVDLLDLIERFNQEHDINITPRIGVDCGTVISGLISGQSYAYSLWGEPVNVANRICYEAPLNAMLVTQAVYEQLEESADFKSRASLEIPRIGEVELWEYNA
ncbi:MAG: adenylate/guanylate cyclase domain-containing protein [Thiolinea sp.]